MPYSSNSALPESVRSRYSSKCQSVYRNVFNSVHGETGDEGKASAAAHAKAKECEGNKAMTDFTIFAPLLKSGLDQSDGKRRLHGTASSTVKDRQGHVITLEALRRMESEAGNLTIFLNHDYRVPEDVAGSVEKAEIRSHPSDPDIHDLVFDIVVNEANPRAISAWEAIRNGTQLGLSIGARIPENGATKNADGVYTISDIELLETSLVGVPASPRSWVDYAVKSLRREEILKSTSPNAIGVDVEETEDEVEPENVEEAPAVELASADADDAPDAAQVEPPTQDPEESAADPNDDQEVTFSETPQDALPESNPENGDLLQDEDSEITLTALLASVDSLQAAHAVIESQNRELGQVRKSLADAEEERDKVVALSQKTMDDTTSLLERLQKTSMGRLTHPVVVETARKFDDLRSVYTDDVMALLTKER